MRLTGYCIAFAVAVAAHRAPAQCTKAPEALTQLGFRKELSGLSMTVQSPARSVSAGADQTRYARYHLRKSGAEGGGTVLVRDGDYRLVQVVQLAEFKNADGLWTVRVQGRVGRFELVGASGGAKIEIDEVIEMPLRTGGPVYYSYQGSKPTYVELFGGDTFAEDRRLGDGTGFLMGGFGQQTWCCTAVMVAADLALTNWHCGGYGVVPLNGVWSKDVCARTILDFSWDGDATSNEYGCVEVVELDPTLDFAVLRVASIGPAARVPPVRLASGRVAERAPLRLVHHPECQTKRLSRGDVANATWASWDGAAKDADFTHTCDTENGSSGGPVFDASGALVGLHHHGFNRDASCNPDHLNKAIHVEAILKALRPETRKLIAP